MNPLESIARAATNPVNLAQFAMGPGAITVIAARTMGSAIAQQAIQIVGQQLGVPQAMIRLAQQGLSASMGTVGGPNNIRDAVGQVADQLNLSPSATGRMTREATKVLNDLVSKMSESEEFKEAKASKGAKGGAGGGWLRAMAQTLGDKLNALAKEVNDLAGEISKDTPDKTALFGAATQEFGILMNATSNGIKTIGEGLANTSRKN